MFTVLCPDGYGFMYDHFDTNNVYVNMGTVTIFESGDIITRSDGKYFELLDKQYAVTWLTSGYVGVETVSFTGSPVRLNDNSIVGKHTVNPTATLRQAYVPNYPSFIGGTYTRVYAKNGNTKVYDFMNDLLGTNFTTCDWTYSNAAIKNNTYDKYSHVFSTAYPAFVGYSNYTAIFACWYLWNASPPEPESYPITYIPINSTLSGPESAASGDTVSVDVTYPGGYIYQERGISVYNTDGAIAHSYDPATGKLTFTMP